MVDRRRLFRAQNQDISIQSKVNNQNYIVSGSRGITYQVNPQEPSCTCPDWKKREPSGGCKHILAVKIHRGDIDPLPSANTTYNPQSRSRNKTTSEKDNLAKRTKERDNWKCQICGNQGGKYGSTELHAHHIIPKSKGGEDTPENLITVCHSCHEEIHGHQIPTGERYSSLMDEKSLPSSARDRKSDHGLTHENKTRCKSCDALFKKHTTMSNICNECLSEKEPNQQTNKNAPTRPIASKDNYSRSQITASDKGNENGETNADQVLKDASFLFGFFAVPMSLGAIAGWWFTTQINTLPYISASHTGGIVVGICLSAIITYETIKTQKKATVLKGLILISFTKVLTYAILSQQANNDSLLSSNPPFGWWLPFTFYLFIISAIVIGAQD